jgi:hypothetical protein
MTHAGRTRHRLCRRCDGLRHKPWGFSRNTAGDPLYERATGARLIPRKSKALAIGAWTEPPTALGIDFHERVNILGVEFGPTIAISIRDSWSKVMCAVRAQARRAYTRHLCLVQRMKYIQLPLFAKIWHVSQIFPLPLVQTQQLTTIFFLVPMAGGNL